jgi:hypothetical protein
VKRLWSLIGLLLIVPWGKLVAAIGLIDLPGQVREWGSLLGFLKSTQITLGMAVIGLVMRAQPLPVGAGYLAAEAHKADPGGQGALN